MPEMASGSRPYNHDTIMLVIDLEHDFGPGRLRSGNSRRGLMNQITLWVFFIPEFVGCFMRLSC